MRTLTRSVETRSRTPLRYTSANRHNVKRATRAELGCIQLGLAAFTLTHGRPELFPNILVTVRGFEPEIDAATWLITRDTRRLNQAQLRTELALDHLTPNTASDHPWP